MHRARRVPALAALAITAVALATGCSATNPQTTTLKYDPADGQDVTVGPVDVDSLLIVSKEGTNGPGTLVARLTNSSGTAHTVTIKGANFEAPFTVPANGAISVGPKQAHAASIPVVGAKPGGIVSLTVASQGGTGHRVQVPVLTSTQPEFASLVPTPTPTPTMTPTPSFVAPPSDPPPSTATDGRTSTGGRSTAAPSAPASSPRTSPSTSSRSAAATSAPPPAPSSPSAPDSPSSSASSPTASASSSAN